MFSPPHAAASRRLPRWLALLAACAAPLLAQAQGNCTGDNDDGNYILGDINGTASAMHWPTGMVWKRCIEGDAFSGDPSGNGACTTDGVDTEKSWNDWAATYLPQPFAGQADWGISAGYSQNLLHSGGWRMAYLKELLAITKNCGSWPKVNRKVFPNTPSTAAASFVWSGSPYAGDFSLFAWELNFVNGGAGFYDRDFKFRVRLVRAGQPFAPLTSPAARDGASGATVTFPPFTLAASVTPGQAWGGARIAGAGSPEFQVNGQGDWVQEAIVKSGDAITVRLTAPAPGSGSTAATATFTLRSGLTTGTSANAANAGLDFDEGTVAQTTTASFTAHGPRYTKIANNGTELPDGAALGADASEWACTRDNATGRVWEVKTTSGLRSQDHTYTWYDSHSPDGSPGFPSITPNCATAGRCDTEKYTEDVNAAGLCGAADWRMPTRDELLGIVDASQATPPKIDPGFFPHTLLTEVSPSVWSSLFWSGSPYEGMLNNARVVDFYSGNHTFGQRNYGFHVRLVRAGPVLTGPDVQDVTHNSATVQATSSLAGTGWWLVRPSSSLDPAPTPAQVKAGGQSFAMPTAGAQASGAITGLSACRGHGLYLVAEDAVSHQLSGPVQKVTFTTATPVNGQCGSAHGEAFTSKPTTGLCSPGTAINETGTGPWSWICQGIDGGSNSGTCTASLQTWAVTASASPTQGGTATCNPATVAHDGSTTCTATANADYRFTAWTGACAGQGATCTLADVTEAQHSVAQFAQHTLTLTLPEGPQTGQPLTVAVQPANGWQLVQVSAQTAASLGAALPAGMTLPHGVVRLRLEHGVHGSEATVVLTYPQALPPGTVYYKFGRTADDPQPHWYAFPGAHINGNTITLTLRDGGAGDNDLQANSAIDDPGGPALRAAQPAAIPTLGEWALALLAALLGLFSLGALRRRAAGD